MVAFYSIARKGIPGNRANEINYIKDKVYFKICNIHFPKQGLHVFKNHKIKHQALKTHIY